jgi:NADH-quinone oxidoreductase subunit M
MILMWLIVIPLTGGLISWAADRRGSTWSRWIALVSQTLQLAIGAGLWWQFTKTEGSLSLTGWLIEMRVPWVPHLGVSFHLAIDGVSLLLVLLTALLGLMAVLASWTEVKERTGFFHFNLLMSLAGITGVFLALDLFLFYFFWEMMLVPIYFLIALWGHEHRRAAAVKFFIFTQMGGLLMLMAIIGLVFIGGSESGVYSFDYVDLLGTTVDPGLAMTLFAGFLAAFLVKLPAVPFHTWLPDAHMEAPTGGSVILAGLLLKTGAYGLIRFAVPLFPDAAILAPIGMAAGAVGILYGAILAFAQTDLKRLIAYTSISHMGFVLLGISAWNETALHGVMVQIICHGISTGALFMLAGLLQERIHTRDIGEMGGLWLSAPRLGGTTLFFGLASLGLPGLGNFMGEFLVLLGSYEASIGATVLAACGLLTACIYSLWMVWRSFFGMPGQIRSFPDLSVREMAPMALLIILIVWIGLFPQKIIDVAGQGFDNLGQVMEAAIHTRAEGGQPEKAGPQGWPARGLSVRLHMLAGRPPSLWSGDEPAFPVLRPKERKRLDILRPADLSGGHDDSF